MSHGQRFTVILSAILAWLAAGGAGLRWLGCPWPILPMYVFLFGLVSGLAALLLRILWDETR